MVAAGAWLFRNRGWLPAPFVLVILFLASPEPASLLLGGTIWILAEGLRLWAVRHIGPCSRTRDSSVGPLTTSGPYRYSRNPLYLANMLFYAAFGLAARCWAALPLLVLVFVHYSLVIRWEEQRLNDTHGSGYARYLGEVHRWLGPPCTEKPTRCIPWRQALRSERSTLLVLLLMATALVSTTTLRQ